MKTMGNAIANDNPAALEKEYGYLLMNEEFRKKAAQALHDGVIKVLYEMEDKV